MNTDKNKNKYITGSLITEGKTKIVYGVLCEPHLCIIESKNSITANDDPSLTREFATKAIAANTTTCNVFMLLKKYGIPIAFENMLSETEFLSQNCTMIPLEVVVRRYAVGSYLKRKPVYQVENEEPFRFEDLCVEFFLKTTGGTSTYGKEEIINNLEVEDPFIVNPYDQKWRLLNPKMELFIPFSHICTIDSLELLDENVNIKKMETLARQVFEVLEEAFEKQKIRLIDFKIEFGINHNKGNEFGLNNDELVIADVIDNDSWRIVTEDWEDLSKQSFRDGQDLTGVEKKYLQVMEISLRF
jgi:phosphoribosylaminoimidazole-succinocarboxamide synthase